MNKINLTTAAQALIQSVNTKQFTNWFADGIEFYLKQFKRIPAGRNRAHNLHIVADRAVAEDRKLHANQWLDISCRQGCAHCCHQQVMITDDEGDLLAGFVEHEKLDIDFELLKRQVAFKGNDVEWFNLPKSENRCVFLGEDNRCRVYEHRPLMCRKYYVSSPPEKCGGSSGQKVTVKAVADAEIATSAAITISKPGPLAAILWRHLKKTEWAGAKI
jgi:Fe-S-cluster containining protein